MKNMNNLPVYSVDTTHICECIWMYVRSLGQGFGLGGHCAPKIFEQKLTNLLDFFGGQGGLWRPSVATGNISLNFRIYPGWIYLFAHSCAEFSWITTGRWLPVRYFLPFLIVTLSFVEVFFMSETFSFEFWFLSFKIVWYSGPISSTY